MGKSANLAKGGLLTAGTVILLYLSSVLPTNRISLITLASCLIPMAIITTTVKNAFLVYIASSLLGIVFGLRGSVILYIMFFGVYGFVKLYVEKFRSLPKEYIMKLFSFNISLLMIYALYGIFSLGFPTIKFPLYIIMFMVQIAFLAYDYALTVFITYINRRIGAR
jgi:hypothetical protein